MSMRRTLAVSIIMLACSSRISWDMHQNASASASWSFSALASVRPSAITKTMSAAISQQPRMYWYRPAVVRATAATACTTSGRSMKASPRQHARASASMSARRASCPNSPSSAARPAPSVVFDSRAFARSRRYAPRRSSSSDGLHWPPWGSTPSKVCHNFGLTAASEQPRKARARMAAPSPDTSAPHKASLLRSPASSPASAGTLARTDGKAANARLAVSGTLSLGHCTGVNELRVPASHWTATCGANSYFIAMDAHSSGVAWAA
mmetsp:Transcript_39037/g.107528  ORF Transcript_39037/g.107528 Transcript_39037/m.107528 type:complete len:265 (+) Transcript_39037:618-1412(+)